MVLFESAPHFWDSSFDKDSMRFRPATLKDYRQLIALDRMASNSSDRRRWLRRSIAERSVYVLTENSNLVAYGTLSTFFQRPFVEMLYVSESKRRQGYGERLLARLEDAHLKRGEVWTSTNRSNHPMQRLLKKRGFRFFGRVTGLDKGDAELFYCKKKPNQ